MAIDVNWSNPYHDRRGSWLKGNMHTHSAMGRVGVMVPAEELLEIYGRAGYDFLAISDHMAVTVPQCGGPIAITGVEWNSESGEHTGIYGLDAELLRGAVEVSDHGELLAHLRDKDVLVVLNHPNWQMRPHYRREELEGKEFFDAIEIYNGLIEVLAGYAISTDKWDYLLTKGRRVLGLASDDTHAREHIGKGWFHVRAAERSSAGVLAAIRSGNFYCTNGVEIIDIRRNGSVIEVETADAEEICVISDGGGRIAQTDGSAISFTVPNPPPTYVRFEAYGRGSSMAWTQPFFCGPDGT